MNDAFFPLSEKEANELGLSNRFSANEQAEFPKRLKELRKAKNETLAAAADGIGVTRSTLGLYEKGENVPDVKTIVRIARHYGATLNYLLGEDERPTFGMDYLTKKTGLSSSAVDRICLINKMAEDPFRESGVSLKALSALLENNSGIDFLKTLYFYLLESETTITINNTKHSIGDDFEFCVMDVRGFIGEVRNGPDFIKMLQDARVAQLQELISDLRKEARKGL